MRLDTHCHLMLRDFHGRQKTDVARLLRDLAACEAFYTGRWQEALAGSAPLRDVLKRVEQR